MPYPYDVNLGVWHYLPTHADVTAYLKRCEEDHLPDFDGADILVEPIDADSIDSDGIFVQSHVQPTMDYVEEELVIGHVVFDAGCMLQAYNEPHGYVRTSVSAQDVLDEFFEDDPTVPAMDDVEAWLVKHNQRLTERLNEKLDELLAAFMDTHPIECTEPLRTE